MSDLKVVVTGGAGFIGSHIAEYWSAQDADVHVIDNLRTGKRENIGGVGGVTFHHVSITDRAAVFEILDGARYVHHLAALVSVPESVQKPLECVEINVRGLINVLDAAAKHRVRKIVHSSSAAVYGDNPRSVKETDLMPMPKSPYGITKLDGEHYLQVYQENFGLEGVSLRYFNVFGPRQDPHSQYAAAVPIFISRAVRGEPIIIYGDGEQTRDFIYVRDVVDANVLAATSRGATGVFNIAQGRAITINALAKIIVQEAGSMSTIVHGEERPGEIRHSLASIERTLQGLKFTPQYALLDGLRETALYLKGREN
ncbi:MAG TPA: NAD-dependent epimerase/dehydratase family protein [Bacteroidota bacterium]|nr:NAD-dependent epimerase/dehydratase family protein [Bacteroidota bacterium]